MLKERNPLSKYFLLNQERQVKTPQTVSQETDSIALFYHRFPHCVTLGQLLNHSGPELWLSHDGESILQGLLEHPDVALSFA